MIYKLLQFISITVYTISISWAQTDTTTNNNFFVSSVDEVMTLTQNTSTSVTTASKKAEKITEAAGVISIVTQKEIEAFGALSLVEVLDRLTSIYAISTYAYPNNMVSIRGNNTEQYNYRVLVLLDGRPVRESMFLGENRAIYTLIPLQIVDRIEVLRGPGSTLYGTSAFTGAINIITKKGKEARKFLQSILYGSFNRFQTSLSGGVAIKNANLSWGLNYLDDEGWDFKAIDENGLERTIAMSERGIGAQVRFDYKNFSLNGYYGQTLQSTIGNSPRFGSGSTRPYDDYRSYSARLFLDAGYEFHVSKNFTNQTNITYNNYDFRFFYIEANDISREAGSNDVLVENTTFWNIGKKLEVVLGGVVNYRQGNGTEPVRNLDGSRYDIFSNPDPNPSPFVFVPNSEEIFWGVYAQTTYQALKYLKIVAGGQLNKAPGIPIDIVPRLAFIGNFNKNLGAKLLYGQAFRSPSISERFRKSTSAFGDPELAPEKITTVEAQVFYDKPGLFTASLTYFNNQGTGMIRRSRPSDSLFIVDGVSVAKYINDGKISTQGIEFEGKYLATKRFSLQASGTYTWTPQNNHNGQEIIITGMPNIMAKVGISYRLPRYATFGIFHSYFDKGDDIMPQQQVNANPAPFHFLSANTRINLGGLLHFKGTYAMYLELYAKNLLNAQVQYPEYIRRNINSIPGRAGRAFYGSLKFSF